jgi:hypothetical protein
MDGFGYLTNEEREMFSKKPVFIPKEVNPTKESSPSTPNKNKKTPRSIWQHIKQIFQS